MAYELSKDGNSLHPWLSIILDASRYVILTADPSKFHSHYPDDANPFDARYHSRLMSFASLRDAVPRYIYLGHLRRSAWRIETFITSNFPIRSRHMCAKLIRASFPPSNGWSRSLPSCLFVANEREGLFPYPDRPLYPRDPSESTDTRISSQICQSICAIARRRGWRT